MLMSLCPTESIRGVRSRLLAVIAGIAVLGILPTAQAQTQTQAQTGEIKPFQATYAWAWRGVTVAVSTLKLEHRADGLWVYSADSQPRGLGRLFPQRPVQRSVMRISSQGVQPLSYHADDGTSSTRRDADVKFDWNHDRATGTYEDVAVDLALKPGVQDDLSVQVALMVQLLRGKTPDSLSMIDKNSIRNYIYKREGDETLMTPFGSVQTVIYSSQHQGSPRITRYWCAPSKGYLPMRVEQKRIDTVEWTLEIQSLQRE